MKYQTVEELYKELNYIPPYGGFDCASNAHFIISCLLNKKPNAHLQLTPQQFNMVMGGYDKEILTYLLLDDRRNINKTLNDGFGFRTGKIRVR